MTQDKKKSNQILILSFILMFILTASVSAIASVTSLYTGLGSRKAVTESFTASKYAEQAYEQFSEDAKECIRKSRLPEKVIGIASEKDFYLAANQSFESAIEKGKCAVDTSDYEKKVQKGIYGYFEKDNIKVDRVIKESVDQLTTSITGIYRVNAEFTLGEGLYNINRELKKMMMIVVPVLGAIAVIAAVMLVKCQKHRHRGYRYLAFSLTASAAVTTLFVQLFYRSSRFAEDYITGYYGEFVNEYIRNAHSSGNVVCMVLGLIAIVSIIYSVYRTGKGNR